MNTQREPCPFCGGPNPLILSAIAAGLITIAPAPAKKTGRPIVHHDYTHMKQRLCMARLRAARRAMKEDAA